MNHLEFTEKLSKLGCSFNATNLEDKIKEIEIPSFTNNTRAVEIKNFILKYKKPDFFGNSPISDIIKIAIDMDEWKHSIHNEVTPGNYEKFKEIIQGKILKRANEIDLLFTAYFQLSHELTANNANGF